MRITGKVQFQNLEGGFWSIVSGKGEKYRPLNMPEQLKTDGADVEVLAIESDEISMLMWGTAVKIISFSTLMP